MVIWKKIIFWVYWEKFFLIYNIDMFEFLAFLVGVIIMGPIVYIYFLVQDLKKMIDKLENKN